MIRSSLVNVDAVEVVDLDALSTDDLLRERADVKVAIATIAAQLMDPTRRPDAPEDGSPAWITSDLLLLKAYRIVRHLLVDGAELPDSLDAQDRDTLGQVAIHLREQFGRAAVTAAMDGSLELEAEALG